MHVSQGNAAGLSPAHVKAVYGYNGDNADPVALRQSNQKPNFVDEAAEDEAFEEQIFGKKKRKNGKQMNASASRSVLENARKDLDAHDLEDELATDGALPIDGDDFPRELEGEASFVPVRSYRRSLDFPREPAFVKPPSLPDQPLLSNGSANQAFSKPASVSSQQSARPVPNGSIRPNLYDDFDLNGLSGRGQNAPSFSLYSSSESIEDSAQNQLRQHQQKQLSQHEQSQHQQKPQQNQPSRQPQNQNQRHDDDPLRGPLGIVRPPLNPTSLPNGATRWDKPDPKGTRTLYKAQIPNPVMTSQNRFQHPSEPPASLASKYGIPTGRATSEPISPQRPDSSRSFTLENVLYGDAILQSPVSNLMPPVIHLPASPSPIQSNSAPFINEHPQAVQPSASSIDNAQSDVREPETVQPSFAKANSPRPPQQTAPEVTSGLGQDGDREPLTGPRDRQQPEIVSPEDQADLAELRRRMYLRDEDRPPRLLAPEGDSYPLATQNITPGQQADVETLRQRMANPQLGRPPAILRAASWDPAIHGPRDPVSGRGTASSVGLERESPSRQQTPKTPSRGMPPKQSNGPVRSGHATVPRLRRLWRTLYDYRFEVLRLFGFFALIALGLLTCFHLGTKAFGGASDDDFAFGPRWYEWDSIKDSFGHIVPDSILHPLQSLGDASAQSLLDRLADTEADVRGLKQQGKTIGKKLDGIGKEVSKAMPLNVDKEGKVQIPEGVWLAIKEKLQSQDPPWSRYEGSGPIPGIPDDVREGLEKSLGYRFTGKKGSTAPDTWQKEVDDRIKKLEESDHAPLTSEKDIKAHVEKLVQSGGGEFLVNSDQFKKQLGKELNGLRSSYETELRDLKDQIAKQLKEVNKAKEKLPEGLSTAALASTLTGLARKAVADAHFQAMARAGVKAHAADHLANQVNFFAEGSGAVIDPWLTSEPWRLPRAAFKSKEFFDRTGYTAQPKKTALMHWNEEGECFCAHTDSKGFGQGTNNVSVLLGRELTPHHLVVEHILPGATLDPGAMPRDLEVWAYIEELNMRETLGGWSTAKFPGTERETTLDEAWVKIGAFTYEKSDSGDGVQVFPFSAELAAYGAVTKQILVRALNNYGADHTCFYRLKLFGQVHQRTNGSR